VDFFVDCENGVSQMFNGVPIYLADRANDFSGISWQTLYFTKESPDQVRGIIEAYKQGMNREQAGIYEKGFTRGLYYRNVL